MAIEPNLLLSTKKSPDTRDRERSQLSKSLVSKDTRESQSRERKKMLPASLLSEKGQLKEHLCIAIDYETWERDPVIFCMFAIFTQTRGHTVVAVSDKPNDNVTSHELHDYGIVLYHPNTPHRNGIKTPKKKFLQEMGYKPDLWIGDF